MKVINKYILEDFTSRRKSAMSLAGTLGSSVSTGRSALSLIKGKYTEAAIFGALGLSWFAWRTLQSAFSQCARHCGAYKENFATRQMCIYDCKIHKYEKIILQLQELRVQNPRKEQKIDYLISKYKTKILKLNMRLQGAKEEMKKMENSNVSM